MAPCRPRALVVLALIVLGVEPALARSPAELGIEGEVPFDLAQLAAALEARAPADKSGARIVRIEGRRGVVRVVVGRRSRTIRLAGVTGASAARIVALVVADLALAEGPVAFREVPAHRPVRVERARLSFGSTLARGVRGRDALSWGASVEVSRPFGSFVVGGSIARSWSPSAAVGLPYELEIDAWTVRLLAGGRAGRWELLVGPFAIDHQISGATQRRDLLLGLGVVARGSWSLAGAWRWFATVGADLHLDRIEVDRSWDPSFRSPALTVWLGAGVTWPLGP